MENTKEAKISCDIAVIGAGPAGLCAGIYAKRAGLDVMVIESALPGGQVSNSYSVDNYLGFESINGAELAEKFIAHANAVGVKILQKRILSLDISGAIKKISCRNFELESKAVIIASGTVRRKLKIVGEEEFCGRGVSYCATCDGNFYKNKVVAVVGGGNTALEDALYLANICEKVYLIHRRDSFRADKILCNGVNENIKIEIIRNAVPTAIAGSSKVEKLLIKDGGGEREIAVDGVFIAVGSEPASEQLPETLERDGYGYIKTDKWMRTNINGVFAAGDIRSTPLRQIITAAADGAVAASGAFKYIEEVKSVK